MKKVTWIVWKNTISSKEMGGFGVGSLKALNITLLAKWWWRVKKKDASLWVTTIKTIHDFFLRSPTDPLLSKKGGTWRTIISMNKLTQEYDIDIFFQI